MAKTLLSFFQRFKTPALDKMIIEEEVRTANLSRATVITGLFVPVTIIIHIYFSYNTFGKQPHTLNPLDNFFALNSYLGLICLILFLSGLWLKRSSREHTLLISLFPHLVFLIFAIAGALCSIYDQALDRTIIIFLLACLLNASTLLIRPLNLILYLTVVYLFFCYGVYLTQPDQQEVMLIAIDALCVIAVTYAIGRVFWNNNLTRLKQDRLIKSQKSILVHQYEKLSQSNVKLEKSNASKDQFFSILAHDLRGPLNSAIALTKFLEEGLFESDHEERQKMYSLLQNSLNNSSKLLENVLLWSTNQAGVLHFKPMRLNVYETVQSSIEILKIVAAQKNIEIINLVSKYLSISADMDMIHTVFRNLLSNAIKFTPNFGSVEIRSEFVINEHNGRESVRISVVDYGVGMSSKTLNNLFRIEKKMIGLGTNNETGTGLGLVLCKDFIEKHEGSIIVESKENEGSKFIITLPART